MDCENGNICLNSINGNFKSGSQHFVTLLVIIKSPNVFLQRLKYSNVKYIHCATLYTVHVQISQLNYAEAEGRLFFNSN